MMRVLHTPAQLIRKFPLYSYATLACLITWLLALPAMPLMAMAEWQLAGQWHPFGALGPALAVAIVLGCLGGRRALLRMFSRLIDWRVAPSWALFCVGSPLVLLGAAVAIAQILGHENTELHNAEIADQHWLYWMLISLLPALIYAVSEEIGWRGYALEFLQRRHSCFTATALVAVLWMIWHLPFFILQSDFSVSQLIGLCTGLFAESVFLTYLYNSSRGSLFLAVIWHMIWSVLSLLVAMISAEVADLMNAMLLLGAAALLFIIDKQTPARVFQY